MSFHPQMEYAPARFHRSERKLAVEGEAFAYTPENQAKFDENVARYPAEQRKSAIIYALYLVRLLEEPFAKGHGSLDDVSFFLLDELQASLRSSLDMGAPRPPTHQET